jgi:predicted metal-dependent peptidase
VLSSNQKTCDIPVDELPECGLIPGRKNKLTVEDRANLTEERIKSIEKFSNFIFELPPRKSSEWYMERIQENKEIKEIINDLYGNKIVAVLDEHDDTELSDAEKALADQKVKDIIKNAKEVASNRGWGSVSYTTRQEIEKIGQSEYSPERALKYFCGMKMRNGYFKTQRKINRKYPYIHAGRKSKKTSNLVVYVDQSGSVGGKSLAMFGKWLEKLSKTHTFTFFYFDGSVDTHSKTTWKKGKSGDFKRALSGGTCFDAVEDHFRTIKQDFDGCIIMTDGYAPKPKSCTSKRCWVICPNGSLQFTPDRKDFVIKMDKGYS